MSTIKTKEYKSKKEDKVPNSLIIYIKTRIPNYYKINYEPFMTVPKTKSDTVYFDPLVKYYEGPIKSIPPNAPKNTIYTQFFEASEFDTMINRTLSDFRYMQKPKTLQQSFDDKIIENNLKITLKTLFKPNTLFYINNKPYTIVGSHWKDSDWQIDKKPIEKLLNQFYNLTPKELELEAKKEEDDIPEVLRQGNLASSGLKNDETVSSVATGLKNAVEKVSKVPIKKEISGETESFVPQDKLPGVSEDMKRLYSEFLRQNIPINYSDIPDLARDSLTLSLLIDPSELLKFINKNKKSSIVELYSTYVVSKTKLQATDKEYIDACTELAIYKTTFDSEVTRVRETINTTNPISKENKNKIIQHIMLLKINYMTILFKIADSIMEIYKQQHIYFVSTKALLEGLEKDYVNIIKYYEKPELAIKCIQYDISTLNSLIELDPENPYSQSYFSNYNAFKHFYEKTLYENESILLTPSINYLDEEHYINDKGILFIEKQQYEIYNFKMFLFYSYNQFDIWVILFKSIQIFTQFVGTEAIQILQNSEKTSQNYNSYYSEEQQRAFTEKMHAEGIRASYESTQKRVKWHLVKKDGTKCIEPVTKKSKLTPEIVEDEIHEKIMISSIKSQVHAYDAIVLYIYLLEVVCLRQNRVYVAEENVNQLNIEFSLTLNEYYYTIERSIDEAQAGGLDVRIPTSLLWDTSKFKDKNVINNRKNINDKSSIVYRGRIKAIQKSRQEMIDNCEAIADIITPNLSKSGFVSKCQTLLASNFNDINKHSFRSSYWLEKTIVNYNNEATSHFIYNMNNVVKDAWYDRITLDREPEDYLDWMVYDNSGTNTNETIYAAISDALNGQLDLNGDDTSNPYTEKIDDKNRFTVTSLTKLVNDVNNDPNILPATIINILQEVLNIKFLIFEMFMRENNEIQLGDIVEYNNEKYRVVDIQTVETSEKTYTLYNGYNLQREIPSTQVKLTKTNLYSNFRIDCNYSSKISTTDFQEIIYLVLSKQTNDKIFKYRLVKNSSDNNYIHTPNIIPSYIKYLIYNNCARFTVDKIAPNFGIFSRDFNTFTDIIDKKIETEYIKTERKQINKDLYNKKKEYKQLKQLTDKTQDQKTRQTILKGDIADLIERQKQVESLYKTANAVVGGAPSTKPSDQYVNVSTPYYNPLGYPMNPNMQTNTFYLPQGYNRYQKRLPYNVSQNKAKDLKSKLSFYITVELELFPGKSVNALQKSIVRCQSTFERIREAYAEIFGFQYRPAAMTEAYSYDIKPPHKNGTSRNNASRNNASRNNTYKNRK